MTPARLARRLPKRVQHIYGVLEGGDVQDPVLDPSAPGVRVDSDLASALPTVVIDLQSLGSRPRCTRYSS